MTYLSDIILGAILQCPCDVYQRAVLTKQRANTPLPPFIFDADTYNNSWNFNQTP